MKAFIFSVPPHRTHLNILNFIKKWIGLCIQIPKSPFNSTNIQQTRFTVLRWTRLTQPILLYIIIFSYIKFIAIVLKWGKIFIETFKLLFETLKSLCRLSVYTVKLRTIQPLYVFYLLIPHIGFHFFLISQIKKEILKIDLRSWKPNKIFKEILVFFYIIYTIRYTNYVHLRYFKFRIITGSMK